MSDFTQPRITEKRYIKIPPAVLIANSTDKGIITIDSTYGLKAGQCVLFKQGVTFLKAKIQRVISETQFIVVDQSESITTNNKLDMSAFLIGATVELQEVKRPVIDLLEIQRQVYEEEPTVALRAHQVDWLGRSYDASNPMPVKLSDGSINIGAVNGELEVQLSHQDNSPDAGDIADSIRIGDGTETLEINPDGSINSNVVNIAGAKINPTTEETQVSNNNELVAINVELDTIRANQTNATQRTQITNSAGTNSAEVDSDLNLHTEIHGNDPQGVDKTYAVGGRVDSNSTDTPLGSNATFTGTFVDCSQYSSIIFSVLTDQFSAVDGAKVEFSTDGTVGGILRVIKYTVAPLPDGGVLSIPCEGQFFRVVYVNGAVAQTVFKISTLLKSTTTGETIAPLVTPLTDLTTAPVTRTVVTGKSTDGAYVNQRAAGISTINSTSTPLGVGIEFTGDWEECLGYSNINVTLSSDVGSAEDGIIIEWSTDGVNVDNDDLYTSKAVASETISFGVISKYFRVRYVNGAVAQTYFRLQVLLHIARPKPSVHRVGDPISGQNDAELSKSVITGQKENGVFSNVGLSNSSSIKVAITDRPSEVRGRVHFNKNIEGVSLTLTPTLIHTVTPGYTFYMTSLIVSALNEGNAIGRMVIRDGGSNKIPFILPSQASGAAASTNVASPPMPEPMPFTTNIGVIELAGAVIASITIIGYEELNP